MTDEERYARADAIYDAYGKIRELQKIIDENKAILEEDSGGEDMILKGPNGDRLLRHIRRIEDYIRGANATALKAEAPDLFAKYGKTSDTITLKIFAENE